MTIASTCFVLAPSSDALVRSSYLLLVVRPGATSSVLALQLVFTSSDFALDPFSERRQTMPPIAASCMNKADKHLTQK